MRQFGLRPINLLLFSAINDEKSFTKVRGFKCSPAVRQILFGLAQPDEKFVWRLKKGVLLTRQTDFFALGAYVASEKESVGRGIQSAKYNMRVIPLPKYLPNSSLRSWNWSLKSMKEERRNRRTRCAVIPFLIPLCGLCASHCATLGENQITFEALTLSAPSFPRRCSCANVTLRCAHAACVFVFTPQNYNVWLGTFKISQAKLLLISILRH